MNGAHSTSPLACGVDNVRMLSENMYMAKALKISATDLRKDLFNKLDLVAKKGEPVEIERSGVRLQIIRVNDFGKLSRLPVRDAVWSGSDDDLIYFDWAPYWARQKRRVKK